ncbi:MAG TPA: TonB-dependent receptor [Candidatus Binatia bacterium]|nr:TonB-dependent receptor [Candidatus Binatia bacterium]
MRWLVLGFVIITASRATAEDLQRMNLPDVVITATRTETQLNETTTAITAVSGQAIEQRDQTMTADALRPVPGTDITEFGSAGQSAFASIRGAAPDQVLVLIDGVKVNDPTTGQYDFANLTTENIDRIEVLRGGGGALYGSEAIGGVINILTPRGQGPFRFSLRGEGGSGATHREVLGVNGSRGPLALSGTISSLMTDGFLRINDDYRNFSTIWRADVDVLPKGTLRGFLRYTNARTGLPYFNIVEGRLDPDAHSRSDFFLAKGEWAHALSDNLHYRVSTSIVRDNERYQDDQIDEEEGGEVERVVRAHFPTEIITTETQWDYLWRNMALTTIGFEFQESSAHIFKSVLEEDDEGDREISKSNPNRSNVAFYMQQQLWGFDDTTRAVGGLRYDHYDQFGDELTWSGSGSYLIRPTSTRLRLGYAEGFRVPTFNELFEPSLGNPQLQPEHSWEINAGFIQEFPDLSLSFESTYFYRKVHNLIEEVADQLPGAIRIPEEDDETTPLTRNLDARLQGVEVISQAQPWHWLTLSGNYTYLDFKTPTGTLLNRPRHRGSFVATATRNNLFASGDYGTLSLLVFAVGPRDSADPHDDFEPEKVPGYARTDLALSYRFGGRLAPVTLHATIHNLFDNNYSESLGFRAPPLRFLVGLSYPFS